MITNTGDLIENKTLPETRNLNSLDYLGPVVTLPPPELTVIIPTYNERDNIPILIDRLKQTLIEKNWEAIFVDDNSPDETYFVISELAKYDRRIRCIRRIGRRGLSGACLEGILASQSKFVAIMDGDLQHDECRLINMLELLHSENIDLVVATRYAKGVSSAGFSRNRARISKWATNIAKQFLGITSSDPMSGFFMIRRSVINELAPSLSTQGFKILLDIFMTAKGRLKIAEVSYSFGKRAHGHSKLDANVVFDFVSLVLNKLTNGFISARFIFFSFVGLMGLSLHMILLNFSIGSGLRFETAQFLSTILVIASNFTLNNWLTYYDQRLIGKRFLSGLVRFEMICSIGLISNVGIASWIFGKGDSWWLAGLSGALMGAIWNYMVSATFVWRQHK